MLDFQKKAIEIDDAYFLALPNQRMAFGCCRIKKEEGELNFQRIRIKRRQFLKDYKSSQNLDSEIECEKDEQIQRKISLKPNLEC